LKGAEYRQPRDLAIIFVACKNNPKCLASARASLAAAVARIGLPFHSKYFPVDDKQNTGWTWKTKGKEPEHNFTVSAFHWSVSRDCPMIRIENDHCECYVRWNEFLTLNKEKLLAFNKQFSSFVSSSITFPPHYPSLQTQQTNNIWKLWLSSSEH
jgi:hypothetical protein